MMKWLVILLLCTAVTGAEEKQKHDYPLTPLSFEKVTLRDSFWLPRLKTQARVTVPFALGKTEPAVENLRRCGNFLKGRGGEKPFTHRFVSSDLYKVMEGAAYILMIERDPALEKQLDEIIDIIAAAQKDDGYLYVSHTCKIANPREMGETPYSWIVHSHELYNMGHMYEGAIAYYRATGKDTWLEVAEKSARHFNRVIFEGDPGYNNGKAIMQAPGHQELELALCKLYRVTGEKLYLEMAKRFLDIRGVTYCPQGEGVMAPEYAQQHKPVREQTRAVGHAVRAAYLYAGMADVAALTGDMTLADALEKIWHNIVDTKMHITGGLGAVHGIEGFGPEYVLPNKNTYDETCAAVANVFFNFRMYLLHKDARYFDVAEVALLNNSLAGISISGDRFFYVNPLEADGIKMFNHGKGGRSPWFGCACCPSNLARLMPQVSGYMYAHTDSEIYLTLYGSSETEIPMPAGKVAMKQVTDYPFGGKVVLSIDPATSQKFALRLRIPSWARDRFVPGALYSYIDDVKEKWTLSVNGEKVTSKLTRGFATIERTWKRGDRVTLHLPMPVRYNGTIDKVKANRDRIAITRGPLVYCAEQVDNEDDRVQRFFITKPARLEKTSTRRIEDGPLTGVTMVSVPGMKVSGDSSAVTTINLVPYYAWSNRGEASMVVWMPRHEKLARESMKSNLLTMAAYGKVLATHTCEEDTVAAVVDGMIPKRSADQRQPRWTSLPFKNRGQNIIVEFNEPRKVQSIAIYWYENPESGKIKLPRDWWVDYRVGEGDWTRMKKYVTDFYGLERDTFNVVRPAAPLQCDAISIRILPQVGFCMGVHEVQVEFEPGTKGRESSKNKHVEKNGKLVLQVDLALPRSEKDPTPVPGTLKPGWTPFVVTRWADMYMHDAVWEDGSGGSTPPKTTGLADTGVHVMIECGGGGNGGFHVFGMCRDNLGGGGKPTGKPAGDPIANGWFHNIDWGGEKRGDILLRIHGLPAGDYEMTCYHNHWEPRKQSTRNCLDQPSHMPPMIGIRAMPLPAEPLPGYRNWDIGLGTGAGVSSLMEAKSIVVTSETSDESVATSVIKFSTDATNDVLVIIEGGDDTYPDPARKGREGHKAVLNAFTIIRIK